MTTDEPLPGVSGNKGTWDQKKNNTRNTGLKACLGNREHQIEEIPLGSMETQEKICWEQGNINRPGSLTDKLQPNWPLVSNAD